MQERFRLKDSVYALEDPASGLYIRFTTQQARLEALPRATLAPATQRCRRELIARAVALPSAGCELVRVDA